MSEAASWAERHAAAAMAWVTTPNPFVVAATRPPLNHPVDAIVGDAVSYRQSGPPGRICSSLA